jgi:hypothetical protein
MYISIAFEIVFINMCMSHVFASIIKLDLFLLLIYKIEAL